jgi:hypothetical protein
MGQILHGSAIATAAVRRAIQHSQESLRALANRYGINQKTVAKWKKRTSAADLPVCSGRSPSPGTPAIGPRTLFVASPAGLFICRSTPRAGETSRKRRSYSSFLRRRHCRSGKGLFTMVSH